MATEKELNSLVINKVESTNVYNYMKQNSLLNEDELYLVLGDDGYVHPSYTEITGVPTANQTPAFGGTFQVSQPISDSMGHITAINSRTVTIPSATATTSANGLMSKTDKSKLDGITESADSVSFSRSLTSGTKVGTITINGTGTDLYAPSSYTHPSYTAKTGVPTENLTPAFGGTFNVSQPVSDNTGHITAINSRTITIPKTTATTKANGLMSSTDKSKLDNVHAKAVSIVVNSSQPSGQVTGDFWYKIL